MGWGSLLVLLEYLVAWPSGVGHSASARFPANRKATLEPGVPPAASNGNALAPNRNFLPGVPPNPIGELGNRAGSECDALPVGGREAEARWRFGAAFAEIYTEIKALCRRGTEVSND